MNYSLSHDPVDDEWIVAEELGSEFLSSLHKLAAYNCIELAVKKMSYGLPLKRISAKYAQVSRIFALAAFCVMSDHSVNSL